MAPKEKAKELLFKYATIIGLGRFDEKGITINSALIAVNEIIRSWESDGNKRLDVGVINYWQEVKSELEKLK